MADEPKQHLVWEWLKRIGLVSTAIVAFFQVCHWFASFQNDLHATIEYSQYELPPTIDRARKHLEDLTAGKDFAEILAKTQMSSNNVMQLSNDLTYLSIKNYTLFNYQYQLVPSGVYHILIRNTGSVAIKDVTLKIPGGTTARIQAEAGTTNLFDIAGAVQVGDIKSKESAAITVWTTLEPFLAQDDIILRHSKGLGTISFTSPLGNPWRWLARSWPVLIFAMPFCWASFMAFRQAAQQINARTASGKSGTNKKTSSERR